MKRLIITLLMLILTCTVCLSATYWDFGTYMNTRVPLTTVEPTDKVLVLHNGSVRSVPASVWFVNYSGGVATNGGNLNLFFEVGNGLAISGDPLTSTITYSVSAFDYDADTGSVKVNGPLTVNTTGVRPFCDESHRDKLWVNQGTTGVADTISMCIKNSSDLYQWQDVGSQTGSSEITSTNCLTTTAPSGSSCVEWSTQ